MSHLSDFAFRRSERDARKASAVRPLHVLKNLGDRVLMPAFTLLFGRYLHGVQESRDGAQFAFVADGLATNLPFAVGIPFIVAYVGLTQRDVVF